MSGKRRLHCGHVGVPAVSHFPFYVCTMKECDGKPRIVCRCGSANVEPFAAPPLVPPGSYHCIACGHVFHPGI